MRRFIAGTVVAMTLAAGMLVTGAGAASATRYYCQWIQTSPTGGQYWCEPI
jgi:hypothetical protein